MTKKHASVGIRSQLKLILSQGIKIVPSLIITCIGRNEPSAGFLTIILECSVCPKSTIKTVGVHSLGYFSTVSFINYMYVCIHACTCRLNNY